MNIIDLIICAILGLGLVSGMYKGFITSTLATLGFIGSWAGAYALYPQLSAAVTGNASIMDMLAYYVDTSTLFKTPGLARTVVGAVTPEQLQTALGEINLPAVIESTFQSNVLGQALASINLSTMADYLNHTLLNAVINVVAFLVMFAISYVVVLLVVNLLNNVFHFPVLRHFDWLAGGALGLIRSAVVVMLIFAFVPMLLSAMPMELVQDMINDSKLAGFFLQNNLVANLIYSIFQ